MFERYNCSPSPTDPFVSRKLMTLRLPPFTLVDACGFVTVIPVE